MAARRPVYRKAALDKLASPEELDQLMQVTRPASWALLAAFGGALMIVLLWGVFGRITTAVEQPGTLTLSNPVIFVPAPAAGQVVEIAVQPGELIAAQQVVGRITAAKASIDVTSPAEGRVIAARARIGDPVDAGTPLVSVESFDRAAEPAVVVYVPLSDRQRVRTGMEARVLPSTVELEEYGYLEGRVQSVAQFAAMREEIGVVLDDSTADHLMAGGPVFEVRIALKTDSAGRFVWSASDGPASSVVSGTPCLVKIDVDEERPISKVFNLAS